MNRFTVLQTWPENILISLQFVLPLIDLVAQFFILCPVMKFFIHDAKLVIRLKPSRTQTDVWAPVKGSALFRN